MIWMVESAVAWQFDSFPASAYCGPGGNNGSFLGDERIRGDDARGRASDLIENRLDHLTALLGKMP